MKIKKDEVVTVCSVTGKDMERLKEGDKVTYVSSKKQFGKVSMMTKEHDKPIMVENKKGYEFE